MCFPLQRWKQQRREQKCWRGQIPGLYLQICGYRGQSSHLFFGARSMKQWELWGWERQRFWWRKSTVTGRRNGDWVKFLCHLLGKSPSIPRTLAFEWFHVSDKEKSISLFLWTPPPPGHLLHSPPDLQMAFDQFSPGRLLLTITHLCLCALTNALLRAPSSDCGKREAKLRLHKGD